MGSPLFLALLVVFTRTASATPETPPLDPALFVIDTGMARVLRPTHAYPAVAWQGGRGLVVGHDAGSPEDIRGMIVDSCGQSLLPVAIDVCETQGTQSRPAVAAAGSSHLVVWQDDRARNWDIYGARVASDGTVLDPQGFPICQASGGKEYPRVAGGDSCWFVVWGDHRTGTNVFGTRVSFDGEVLDPEGLAIAPGAGSQKLPDVAWNGSVFLAVWKSDEHGTWTTCGARVDAAGHILDPGGFFIAGDVSLGHVAGHPAVASDGADFLVVWQNELSPRAVFATRVSGEGRVVGSHVQLLPGMPVQEDPEITYGHGRYFVAWRQTGVGQDLWATRINRDGSIVDTAGILLVSEQLDQNEVAVTSVDGGWLSVWTDQRRGSRQYAVFGVAVDTAGRRVGESGPTFPHVPRYCRQAAPVATAGIDDYLVVWETGDAAPIQGIRLDSDGSPLDSMGFAVTGGLGRQYAPAIASGDSGHLVVWQDTRWHPNFPKIYGARILLDGACPDYDGIAIADEPGEKCTEPNVAFDGENYLVVWQTGGNSGDIYGARVTQMGLVLDPGGFLIAGDVLAKVNPDVAFDGQNYMVLSEMDYTTEVARVSPQGSVFERFQLDGFRGREPRLYFDGTNYLVVRTDPSRYYCYGVRVTPVGQVLDSVPVRLSWGSRYCRSYTAGFDGQNWVVAWEDDWSRAGIKGTLVSPELAKLDSFELTAPTEWGLSSPCLAFAPGSPGILACAGRTPPGMPWDTLSRIHATLVGLPVGQKQPGAEPTISDARLAVQPAIFRHATRILVEAGIMDAVVRVFDASGRCVRNLGDATSTTWHGRDGRGHALPAGIYVVELQAGGAAERVKVVKLE